MLHSSPEEWSIGVKPADLASPPSKLYLTICEFREGHPNIIEQGVWCKKELHAAENDHTVKAV